ncbi:hypothetical protein BC827DRAFT_136507 [Russula dissimulans]|nr:hypothetical protein BC827DRAFT_136507 [Russula dissimulans]
MLQLLKATMSMASLACLIQPLQTACSIHPISIAKQLPFDHRRVNSSTGRVYTLRRTKGTIRSIARRQESSWLFSQRGSHSLTGSRTRSPPRQSGPKPLSPILEQGDSPDLDSGIISPSISTDSLFVDSADSAIHFVDGDSDTTFSRVQYASGTRTSAERFALDRSSLKPSLSLHIGSPTACAATDLDAHVESLPSFMLTLPTPVSPQSPIFSPGVDFTTEKFVNAAEAAVPKDRAPTLPQCDHGQRGGRLCRDCELQLLACRVRFQNADGGGRAALRGPFVRPAQSTVCTRAVLASLGVGARSQSDVGLGLASGRDANVGVRGDGGDNMDDPRSLGIEPVPAASPRPVILDRTTCWSKIFLSQLRVRMKALSLSLSPTINRRRKHYCT